MATVSSGDYTIEYFDRLIQVFGNVMVHRREVLDKKLAHKHDLDLKLRATTDSETRKDLIKKIKEYIGSEKDKSSLLFILDHNKSLFKVADEKLSAFLTEMKNYSALKKEKDKFTRTTRHSFRKFFKKNIRLLKLKAEEFDKVKHLFTQELDALNKNNIDKYIKFAIDREQKVVNELLHSDLSKVTHIEVEEITFIKELKHHYKEHMNEVSSGTLVAIGASAIAAGFILGALLFMSPTKMHLELNEAILAGGTVFTLFNGLAAASVEKNSSPVFRPLVALVKGIRSSM